MIPYHVKVRLIKIAKVLGILCLILLIFVIFRFFWLERYIVYTKEGLYFDFSRPVSALANQGSEILPAENTEPVRIVYDDDSNAESQLGLQPISGYYADTPMLSDHLDDVSGQLADLAPGTAVMLDVKSIFGNFYYSTKIPEGETSSKMDISAIDDLIAELKKSDLYLIARVPAFCDPAFALEHNSAGLPLSSGVLWMDGNGCYWLNPASPTALNYLRSIAEELADMGFDEVVFTDFEIPEAEGIVYNFGDKTHSEILGEAAENLVNAFLGKRTVISFASTDPNFPIPSATSRLYLEGVDASAVASTAQAVSLTDNSLQLVFVTDSRDTRFDTYNVLRAFTLPAA